MTRQFGVEIGRDDELVPHETELALRACRCVDRDELRFGPAVWAEEYRFPCGRALDELRQRRLGFVHADDLWIHASMLARL